ncbi:MAG: YgiT-type zinc finger protein [Anaerolineaceae bacterium]
MRNALPLDPETCPRCFVGRIQSVKVVLSRAVNGQMLSVPDFPAWECDVCHAFMYDPKALLELHQVLTDQSSYRQPKLRRTSKTSTVKKSLKPTTLS